MPSELPADDLLRIFKRRVKTAEKLTDEALKLFLTGKLSQGSLDGIFQSSFMSLHSQFEIFLEDLFYSAITGTSRINDCNPELVFGSREQVRLLVFNKQNYVTWMPYKEGVMKIADRAFTTGGPFRRLDRQDEELARLKEFTDLRNAIAHQSRHSLRQIEHLTSTMRPRRRNAAGYLQSTSQGVTQFGTYSTVIGTIATALAAPDINAAKHALSPERPYKSNEIPGLGVFRCAGCGTARTLRSKSSSIGKCKVCNSLKAKQQGWRRQYL